jgi:hypothetical protein
MTTLSKYALFLLVPVLIAGPAAAADLLSDNNGYPPEQYGNGVPYAAAPGYGADEGYGAQSYCDPNGDPGDPYAARGSCLPHQPYPEAMAPNGPEEPYGYRDQYGDRDQYDDRGQYEGDPRGAAIVPNGRYGDDRDQYDRRPGPGASALPPGDRYGRYPAEGGYRPGANPPVAPGEYADPRGYGTEQRAQPPGYPAESYDRSMPPNDRAGPPRPAVGLGGNAGANGYAPDRTARYGGYPQQDGYALPPAPPSEYSSRRDYDDGPPPEGEPGNPYDRYSY